MRRPVILRNVLVSAVMLLTAAGCATVGERERTAAELALRLLTAVDAGDGEAACAVLAPGTVRTVAEDEPCPQAILDKDLPRPGTVVETSVYGQWAQVELDDDTVFLGAFPGGWRVVAAGCTPQASRPYVCTVEGD
ncbi:hypothetical protein Aab01nite_33990 [Paractinoplanes abujensis]|uniref:Lipoprotein n=1 Tax=Paractinoplanes abujensis TaxID=882441 RepID=A0A7W7G663_9ACTN|nr:hypothetical protein [Actinoplanes abujensis]MBB4697702.1 hypothetical protein [Actinoplanes abujensis]GID19809.1 hypothetical protein Aab01nite_33990 [Actinoplanes abujensis]